MSRNNRAAFAFVLLWAGCHGSYIGDVVSKPEEFGYSPNDGPETWPTRFESCGGLRQSPIDINEDECIVDAVLPPLRWRGHWQPRDEDLEIRNTWHSVEVTFSSTRDRPTLRGGPLSSEFILSQLHFHWGQRAAGSEHSLRHRFYGMEVHLVHYKSKYVTIERASKMPDGLAVVALFLKVPTATSRYENPEMYDLVSALDQVQEGGSNATIPEETMWWLRKYLDSEQYYTYQGSLTTPPCSENVVWIVLKHHGYIGQDQIEAFRQLQGQEGPIEANRRPVQRHNSRHVFYRSGSPFRGLSNNFYFPN